MARNFEQRHRVASLRSYLNRYGPHGNAQADSLSALHLPYRRCDGFSRLVAASHKLLDSALQARLPRDEHVGSVQSKVNRAPLLGD